MKFRTKTILMPLLVTAAVATASCAESLRDTGIIVEGESAESEDAEPAREDEAVNEPIMIGGAFLVCAIDPEIETRSDSLGVGCRLDLSGKKLAVSPQTRTSLAFYNRLNSRVAVETGAARPDSEWSWYVYPPANQVAGSFIKAGFFDATTGVTNQKVAAVRDPLQILPPDATPDLFKVYGADEDFRLTGNSSAVNCLATPQLVRSGSDRLRIPFEITNPDTRLTVIVRGVCGIFKGTPGRLYIDDQQSIELPGSQRQLDGEINEIVLGPFQPGAAIYEFNVRNDQGDSELFVNEVEFRYSSSITFPTTQGDGD